MIDLPKRSDPIYEEIEKFEPYEFTNCIAYEMAIRNDEVIKIKNELLNHQNTLEDIDDWLIFLDKSYEHGLKTKIILKELKQYGLNEFTLYPMEFIFNETKEFIFNETKYQKIITTIANHIFPKNTVFSKRIMNTFEKDCEIFQYALNTGQLEDENEIKTKFKSRFSRPLLKFRHINQSLDINFNLPKDELIAYISKIKDEYDKDNSIIKTPLELLGEDFEKSNNKKINKKLIADKFFIYDYVAARLEEIKQDNLSMYEEYEEQKQEIINNKYIDVSDRKIQLKELKREFEENTNTRINEIFEDIEGFAPSTARRYYYGEKKKGILGIKNFIDDCKYKELITGITAK